jgi:hypothetical protein
MWTFILIVDFMIIGYVIGYVIDLQLSKRNDKLRAKIPVPYENTSEYQSVLRTARDCDLVFPHDPYIPWEQRLENARKLLAEASRKCNLPPETCSCKQCVANRIRCRVCGRFGIHTHTQKEIEGHMNDFVSEWNSDLNREARRIRGTR